MKKSLSYYVTLTIVILFCSCGKPLPTIQDIDLKKWGYDRNACAGVRASTISAITNQKDKFLGLSENDIVGLLGRPDHNELYKRNQKFYYYLLQPSTDCKAGGSSEPLQLVFRFNAMGFAKEVSIEQ